VNWNILMSLYSLSLKITQITGMSFSTAVMSSNPDSE